MINTQTPNRQLWYSSTISGPHRFDYVSASRKWMSYNEEIGSKMDRDMSQMWSNVKFSPCVVLWTVVFWTIFVTQTVSSDLQQLGQISPIGFGIDGVDWVEDFAGLTEPFRQQDLDNVVMRHQSNLIVLLTVSLECFFHEPTSFPQLLVCFVDYLLRDQL